MSLKNRILVLAGVAALAAFAAGFSLRAEMVKVIVEDFPEDEVEDVKSVIAPPVYLGCSQHDFAVKEETGIARCVVCGEGLKPLPPDTAGRLSGALGRLSLRGEQLGASGVISEPVERRRLYTEIRTTGKFALAAAGARVVSETPPVWVHAEVSDFLSRKIRPDSEVVLSVEGLPDWQWRGSMQTARLLRDPETGNVRLRLEIDDPGLEVKPEMKVVFTIYSLYVAPFLQTEVLAVPEEALRDASERQLIWVDKGGGVFDLREVWLGSPCVAGKTASERIYRPALNGLSEGERVVTQATFKK